MPVNMSQLALEIATLHVMEWKMARVVEVVHTKSMGFRTPLYIPRDMFKDIFGGAASFHDFIA